MQESRFLMITVFLVFLIGAPAIYTVVKEPQVVAERNQEGLSETVEADRKPASIVDMLIPSDDPVAKTRGVTRSVTLNVDCNATAEMVQGTSLRVTGSSCAKEKPKEISIINRSNGFTAAVIFTKGDDFTTDFIDLKDGENNLEISTVDSKGQKYSRTLVVTRIQ